MRTAAWLAVGLLSVGVVVATEVARPWRARRPAQQHLTDVDADSLLRALGATPGLEVEIGTFVSGKFNHFVIEITNHGPFPRAVRLPVGYGGIVEDQGTLLLIGSKRTLDNCKDGGVKNWASDARVVGPGEVETVHMVVPPVLEEWVVGHTQTQAEERFRQRGATGRAQRALLVLDVADLRSELELRGVADHGQQNLSIQHVWTMVGFAADIAPVLVTRRDGFKRDASMPTPGLIDTESTKALVDRDTFDCLPPRGHQNERFGLRKSPLPVPQRPADLAGLHGTADDPQFSRLRHSPRWEYMEAPLLRRRRYHLVQELSLVDGSPEVDQAPASPGFPADRVRMRRANIGHPKFLALDVVLTTRWSSLRATMPSSVVSKADALLRLETVLREAFPTDQHACWRRAPLEVSWSWEGGELVASSAPDLPWEEARALTDKVDFHVHGDVVDVLLGNLPIFPEVPWPPGPAPDAWFRSDTAYAEEVQESLNEIFMCSLDFRSLSAH